VEQLRKAITHALRDGEPSIERISRQLGTSSRTLQRRLQEAGTSFRHELSLVRQELALSYLRDPRLQIVDIAMLLGYSEHSAFTRAFKEWSGRSPHEARQLNSEPH
jgi:AraC-type DNA-binding domain-containing proteins